MYFSSSMRTIKPISMILAAAVASLNPAASWACSGCMVGDPKPAGTYLSMTLVMSALPLLLVGGLGYWLWRRHS
jgi:hypothetical protein